MEEKKSSTLDAAAVETLVAETVAKALKEVAGREKATTHMAGTVETEEPSNVVVGKEVIEGTGLRFARVVRAEALAKRKGVQTVDVLKSWGHTSEAKAVTKSVTQGSLSSGGTLVPEEYAAELVPYLRNAMSVSKAGARRLPMNSAQLVLPRQNGAATASYSAEGANITSSAPTTDAIRFSEKKLTALVPVSNDLLKNASISADQWVRDDIVAVAGIKMDSQALFGTGAANGPRGVESLMATANKFNITASSATVPTAAELRVGLGKLIKLVKASNVPMSAPAFIFNAQTEEYMRAITENGVPLFDMALEAGKLRGFPVIVSEQISSTLADYAGSGSTYSRVFFGDWSQFIIAENQSIELEVSPGAAYYNGSSVVAGFSTDETVVRLIMKHDFNVAHSNAFAFMASTMGN